MSTGIGPEITIALELSEARESSLIRVRDCLGHSNDWPEIPVCLACAVCRVVMAGCSVGSMETVRRGLSKRVDTGNVVPVVDAVCRRSSFRMV